MLKVSDVNKNFIGAITEYEDLCIESVLSTGDSTLSFSYELNNIFSEKLQEEGYIRTKFNEYVIKEINSTNSILDIKATLNFEDLEGKHWEHFLSNTVTIEESLNLAFAGTGWIVQSNDISRKRTVKLTNCSSWDILKSAKKIYRADFKFDTLNKKLYIYDTLGKDKGVYFIESLNLDAINIQSNTYDFYTRIIPKGKDNLGIESINENKNYLENHQYSNKVKTCYWKDERYTSVQALKEDAEYKLNEMSKPYRAYATIIRDLAKLNNKYKEILDFELGDTITLISKTRKIKEKQRIVKLIEYPQDPLRNTCELANTTLTFEELQQEILEVADTIENITTDNGTINGETIDSIESNQIRDFNTSVAKITNLETINANIENLTANKADITSLNAVNANIGQLQATKANITDLNATNATITNLQAIKADIVDLNVANGKITILESESAKIGVLEGNVAKIQDVVSGNISSDNIQSGGITGDRLNMNTIFVNDANIININAAKINSGEINTNNVKIKSADGGIEIAGPTQQWKDKNNKVRMQAGKDAQGNFTFGIFDETGAGTLIDHTGVKEKALGNNIIKENMINENAVGAKQINYNSFATGFNKDTNTSTLKATKVKLDNQNQTLEVGFTQLKSQADGTQTQTESNTTQINVQQGQISTAIANTKIIKNGKEILLKDDYNTTVTTVDSMKNTISSHTTKLDEHTGKITSVESKTNVLERDLNSMSSKISATETTVQTHTTQIDIANTNISNVQNTANKNKTDIVTVNTEVTTTKNKVSGIEQDLNSVTTRVGSVESTTTSHTTTINNHTSSLNAVDGKINTAKNTAIVDARKLVDTRSTNENPQWYFANYPRQTITEFKHSNVIQVPGNNFYGTLETKVPWNDSSGGFPVQIFRSNNKPTYERQGTSNTSWGSWNQIEDTVGAQTKATQALNDGKNYTNLEVNKVITSTNSKFAEIKTTTDSITQTVSNTNREVENVKVNLTNKTSINEQTKINGQELVPQGYKVNTGDGFDCTNNSKVIFNNNKITVKGNLWIKTIPTLIKFDRTKPLYWKVNATTTGAQFYVGIERYDKNKNVINNAANGACVYFVSGSTTLNGGVEGWWNESDKTTAYIQLRILCDWNNTGKDTIINEISLKQLSANSQLDTSKEILDIATEKVNSAKAEIKVTTDSITNKVNSVENLTTTINGKVTSHESRINNVEQKTTSSAIINTVSSTVNQAKTEAINSANSSTDGKLNNYITNNKFTEFKQTTENIQATIQQSIQGGINLIKNSNFINGINFYKPWNSDINPYGEQGCRVNPRNIQVGSTRSFGIQTPSFNLEANSDYTITFKIGSMWATGELNYLYLTETNLGNVRLPGRITFDSSTTNQQFVHFTFHTTANYTNARLLLGYEGTIKESQGFIIKELCLTKGSIVQSYKQAVNEIYSNTMLVDLDGLRCKFENGHHAAMTRQGFSLQIDGMNHAYHALTKTGVFNVSSYGNGNWTKCKIQLPEYFKGRYFEPQVALAGFVAGQASIDTITAQVESYNIQEAWFIVQVFCYTHQQYHLNNINVTWVVNA